MILVWSLVSAGTRPVTGPKARVMTWTVRFSVAEVEGTGYRDNARMTCYSRGTKPTTKRKVSASLMTKFLTDIVTAARFLILGLGPALAIGVIILPVALWEIVLAWIIILSLAIGLLATGGLWLALNDGDAE